MPDQRSIAHPTATRRGATAAIGARRPKPAAPDRHGHGRAGRLASRGVIREAAALLFLARGYQGTSMDDVAAAAQVSKQTIYTHFTDKEALFADLVLGNVERVDDFLNTLAATLRDVDVVAGLRRLVRLYVHFVIRPEVLRLRRLVVGESGRFPELARTYYERVPGRVYSTLAQLLAELARKGELRTDDPELAAQHLVWLVLGQSLDRGMFDLDLATPAADELDRIADAGLRVFLAAYRT
jgi:TetR/AcrR family transcriptional repressor of mexJK operon